MTATVNSTSLPPAPGRRRSRRRSGSATLGTTGADAAQMPRYAQNQGISGRPADRNRIAPMTAAVVRVAKMPSNDVLPITPGCDLA
jgi:hypothetical protein